MYGIFIFIYAGIIVVELLLPETHACNVETILFELYFNPIKLLHSIVIDCLLGIELNLVMVIEYYRVDMIRLSCKITDNHIVRLWLYINHILCHYILVHQYVLNDQLSFMQWDIFQKHTVCVQIYYNQRTHTYSHLDFVCVIYSG